MALKGILDMEKLRDRMEEACGSDKQETVARNLGTTQGNISRLLSGKQMPTVELLYLIAKNYKVSVDWLLGLSERKQPIQLGTYGSVVEDLIELDRCRTLRLEEGPERTYQAELDDPLLFALLKRGRALRVTDPDSYERWRNERLARFSDKGLIYSQVWKDCKEDGRRKSEQEWLEIHEIDKDIEEMLYEPWE